MENLHWEAGVEVNEAEGRKVLSRLFVSMRRMEARRCSGRGIV
jgi:hypothetical protein